MYCWVSNTHANADIEKIDYWFPGTHFRTNTSHYFQLEAATNSVSIMYNGTDSRITQECKEVILFSSYVAVLNNSHHHTGSAILSSCRTNPAVWCCVETNLQNRENASWKWCFSADKPLKNTGDQQLLPELLFHQFSLQ